MKRLRDISLPSPAAGIALLALFVALGSGAYAATKIGAGDIENNAVRSRHIKNSQVKLPDLDKKSVSKQFGVGMLGGSGVVPALAANVPGVVSLPVLGSGGGFGMPAPLGMKLRQLRVARGGGGVAARPIIVSLHNDDTGKFLTCVIQIGTNSCKSGSGQRLAFKPGEMIFAQAVVPSMPVMFSGAELFFGYRAAPR